MNFQTILEELDRLYEEEAVKNTDETVEESEEAKELTEAVDEAEVEEEAEEAAEEAEEIELVDDEVEVQQFVLECAKCGAVVIRAEDATKIDEETGMVNVDEACQYCEETAGYKILGTLNPYTAEEAVEEESADEEAIEEEPFEDEPVEEGLFGVDVPISVDVKADGNNVSVLNAGV